MLRERRITQSLAIWEVKFGEMEKLVEMCSFLAVIALTTNLAAVSKTKKLTLSQVSLIVSCFFLQNKMCSNICRGCFWYGF